MLFLRIFYTGSVTSQAQSGEGEATLAEGQACGSSRQQKGNRNERDIHCDRCGGGFGRMIGAVLAVLLAVGVAVCVFLVAWWLLRKLWLSAKLADVTKLAQDNDVTKRDGTRERCSIQHAGNVQLNA